MSKSIVDAFKLVFGGKKRPAPHAQPDPRAIEQIQALKAGQEKILQVFDDFVKEMAALKED